MHGRPDAKKQFKDVLGHLHGNGYVFDDLRKPNVLFTEDERLSLIDFDWAGVYKRGGPEVLDKHVFFDRDHAYNPACREHDDEMMVKLLDKEHPRHAELFT